MLGRRVIDLINLLFRRLAIAKFPCLLRIAYQLVALRRLNANNRIDHSTQFLVDMARGHRSRAGNNQRGSCFIDQDRVYFVDNREIVAVLHNLLRLLSHAIITKIVKAEFAVSAVSNIALILRAALCGIHRVLDAAYSKPQEFVEVAHP